MLNGCDFCVSNGEVRMDLCSYFQRCPPGLSAGKAIHQFKILEDFELALSHCDALADHKGLDIPPIDGAGRKGGRVILERGM
jgi:hypothetical protein